MLEKLIIVIIWVILGLLGCFISNKIYTYESLTVKKIWNTIVFLNGPVSFMICGLDYIGRKLFK